MKYKRSVFFLSLAVLLLCAIFAIACGRNGKKDNNTIKIGITMYDEFDPFTTTIANQIVATTSELGDKSDIGVTCNVIYAAKSQMTQNEQIRDFIEKDYDVICVNLVDRTDAMQIIDMAKNADVPLVFFNRELVKEDLMRWDKLYYVGALPVESGQLQAKIVINALSDKARFDEIDFNHDGKIQYVMLEGEAGHQDAMIRTKVSVEEIKNAGFKLDKLGDEITNWNREQAASKMTSILAGYPWQIELVLANDDNIALGALDALKNAGVPMLPLIVGVNGDAEVMELIKDGKIEGTVYNDAYTKGNIIGRMAFSLGHDENIPSDINLVSGKYVYVPYTLIDKDNVNDFLNRATY